MIPAFAGMTIGGFFIKKRALTDVHSWWPCTSVRGTQGAGAWSVGAQSPVLRAGLEAPLVAPFDQRAIVDRAVSPDLGATVKDRGAARVVADGVREHVDSGLFNGSSHSLLSPLSWWRLTCRQRKQLPIV